MEIACSLIVVGISLGLLTGAVFRMAGLYLVSNAVAGAFGALVGYLDYNILGYTLDQLGWVLGFSLLFIILHLIAANLILRAVRSAHQANSSRL